MKQHKRETKKDDGPKRNWAKKGLLNVDLNMHAWKSCSRYQVNVNEVRSKTKKRSNERNQQTQQMPST